MILVGRKVDLETRRGCGVLWGMRRACRDVAVLAFDPPRASPSRDDVLRAVDGRRVFLLKVTHVDLERVGWVTEATDATYVTFDLSSRAAIERAAMCRRAIASGVEATEEFLGAGVPSIQLLQGWRPQHWDRDVQPSNSVLPQLAFTGRMSRDREAVVAAVRRAGVPVRDEVAYLEDAAQLYRESAAVLCPGPIPPDKGSKPAELFSNRLQRVMVAGGAPLQRWSESVSGIFPHVPTWRTAGDLVELAALYMGNAQARAALVADCREVAQQYRWDLVAARWLAWAREEALPDEPPEVAWWAARSS